jgi:hypothetical protein
MSRPRIRVVIDRMVVRAGGATGEAAIRRAIARGVTQALSVRGVSLRGEHAHMRLEVSGESALPHAAGSALGEALVGGQGRGEGGRS